MGKKYTKEDLERMRSVAVNMGGRLRHTSADTEMVKQEDVRTESGELVQVTTDVGGNVITDHQDGRRDAEVHPKTLKINLTQEV